MQKVLLNADWRMQRAGDPAQYPCSVPCSMYQALLDAGVIEDPFYRENETAAKKLSEDDCTFSTAFRRPECAETVHAVLCFDGIDTIAEIYLNGELLGKTDNMHRQWRFDVTERLQEENTLTVQITSPLRYIAEQQAEHPLWGVKSTAPGFPHIRKAHYMFGWDWGPQLPDMGIWRDVYLECYDTGRITSVQYLQEHRPDEVDLTVKPAFACDTEGLRWQFALYDADEEAVCRSELMPVAEPLTVTIPEPRLWWARGYGEPHLYAAVVLLTDADGNPIDSRTEHIGLRTLTVNQAPDEWGERFCLRLNGVDIFAMGANYIPEDQLLPRCTKERTEALLQACLDGGFNTVRVWGGGYYPGDAFYDFCDENGLIVWQDFMFACANYRLTDAFWENVRAEMTDNILRLRNHASLGLWCGNNEIETAFENWGLPENPAAKADYLEQFEHRMPALVAELDPQRFYWRSSPSAHGGCVDTESNAAGDQHYWDIWHGLEPFTAFRELHYRFCSEYGFESVPCRKTMQTVCDETQGDLNLLSPVMEAHHKCDDGAGKILYYLAQMMRYPESFDALSYATQLVQAECIRSNVEHMRRSRGRCMGSLYWQLGDSNPAISWSSVDYYGRWKALHYFAKRFHAPVLLTAGAFGEPVLNISNETMHEVEGTVHWSIRDTGSDILASGEIPVSVPPLTAVDLEKLTGVEEFYTPENRRRCYLAYELTARDGTCLSKGSSLLCVPKQFAFRKPNIRMELRKLPEHYIVEVSSDVFVQGLALDCRTLDVVFSDNWFDLHGGETVCVTVPKRVGLTLDMLRNDIFVMHQMGER